MKRLLTSLIAAALCLGSLPLAAQVYKSAPVSVSQETVRKDGKVYYAHKVLDHQTLFSISRAYDVSYQDIVDANPDLDLTRGQIQIGQILMIPQKEAKAAGTDTPAPQASPAATVKTPAQQPATAPAAAPEGDYTIYTAKWYEDLNMIAAKFNLSKETLMAYNGLTSDKIEKRQKLRIPNRPESVAPAVASTKQPAGNEATAPAVTPALPEESAPATVGEPVVQAAVPEETESPSTSSFWDLFRKKKSSDKISVAVILPFNAKGQVSHSAFDLYSGMLLAVRDLAKSGIQADLKVIDNKNAATPVTDAQLSDCDLVIGPITPEDLESVLDRCPHATAVVSPLDPKAISLTAAYPNLIQAPSPASAQNLDIVHWIQDDFLTGDKVLLIKEKENAATSVAEYLTASGLQYETVVLSAGEARSCAERIRLLLPARGTAHIVVASERETFFNDVVRNLNLLSVKGHELVLYGPSKVRTFDMVEVENLHRVNAHLSCSYFIDYENPRIKDFLLSYRALFGAEPTQFSYQGYDIASYFIRNFATPERERERMTRLEDRKYRGLQSDFLLTDTYGGGNVNQAVRRVVYGNDYSIDLLNQ